MDTPKDRVGSSQLCIEFIPRKGLGPVGMRRQRRASWGGCSVHTAGLWGTGIDQASPTTLSVEAAHLWTAQSQNLPVGLTNPVTLSHKCFGLGKA